MLDINLMVIHLAMCVVYLGKYWADYPRHPPSPRANGVQQCMPSLEPLVSCYVTRSGA